MIGSDRSVVAALDSEEWHPRYWTLACVGTFHLIFAATVLTIVPPQVPPPVLNVVDVVTFPDGTTTPVPTKQDALPVELKQSRRSEVLPVPKIDLDPKLGPKPTDRRITDTPTDKVALLPPDPIKPTEPTPVAPTPVPAPVPITTSPTPRPAVAPVPVPNPVAVANPEPVTVRATPFSTALVQPEAEPLSISGAKLKLKQAQALKPLSPLEITTPAPPTPAPPSPSAAAPVPRPIAPTPTVLPAPVTPPQAASVTRTPSPPPPAFVAPKTAPLTISRTKTPLPKVQVPRISATDLRLPEVQAAAENVSPAGGLAAPAAPSGVTSVAGGLPRSAGQGGAPPASSGSAVGGSQTGGGSSSPGSNSATSGAGGTARGGATGGPTGILPRRPGGASVRQPFPRGDSNTILGRMDKTYDCSRLNRERDERCPAWDPIEGRNAQGAAGFEVPVPKGLPKLRNPIGTNPLPVCPPGTPGNQMGLSCLPSREGPGIPRP